MANFEPFATAQGTETQGFNMATWPDYAGAAQLQFAQMQQNAGWYQNQGGLAEMWYPQGFDASMLAALNAKLQSPELWMPQLAAASPQMLQQQLMQMQMASGTPSEGLKATTPKTLPAGVAAPPGISSTTPIKAGSSVAVPGEKPERKAAALPASTASSSRPSEAGAQAGQFLLNLVNNKEERTAQQAGAVLLQHLKGGGKKDAGRVDAGAGLALLQQVKSGGERKENWTEGKGWWHGSSDWDDRGKGKKSKPDWAKASQSHWNGAWWGYQDWEEKEWPSRTWAKKGKAKQQDSQESSESSESDDSTKLQAGANSRWRQRKPETAKGTGKGERVTRWKPALRASGK